MVGDDVGEADARDDCEVGDLGVGEVESGTGLESRPSRSVT